MKKKTLVQELDYITGSGGKGSAATGPVEAPNTLQSRATIKLVEVLSEGEVVGIVGGMKGVFLDGTAMQAADGSFNYPGMNYDFRVGLPDQDYMPGFPGVEATTLVNIQLLSPVTQSMATSTDACRVIVNLPQGLSSMDTKTGDLNGYRVGVSISVRPTGGSFVTVLTDTITGKTTTPFEKAYRVERPTGATTWDVKVARMTVAADSTTIADRIDWFTYTEIQDIKISYPDAAVVGLMIDSQATGGAIPGRSYLVDGLIISVPTNYTPPTFNPDGTYASYASYSGSWDGTFKQSWTDNPAWIIYDLLTNERYGLGSTIDPSTIDIYSFYDGGVYCDQLVDDGSGASILTPRFSFNGPIQSRDDAFKTLQAVASTSNCTLFSGPGYIRLIQDRPADPVYTVTNANIIGGDFLYAGSELITRTTSCDVTYNPVKNNYKPATINIEAPTEALTAYGYNKVELTAIGCTSESVARRLGRWVIDNSLYSYDNVTFTVSWSNAFMEIGDIINVADNFYANTQFSGVIEAAATPSVNTIQLDREVTVTTGQVLMYMTFEGVEVTRHVASSTTGSLITLTPLGGADDPSLYVGAAWMVMGDVVPRQFKVMGVSEPDPGQYAITAAYHDPDKYARVESGIYVAPPIFTDIGGFSIAAPTNVVITPETYLNAQGLVSYKLRFNWDDVNDPLLKGYKLQFRKDNNSYIWTDFIMQSEYVVADLDPGVYEYNLYAYNNRNIQSPAISGYYELTLDDGDTDPSPLDPPSGLQVVGGGSTFAGQTLSIEWTPPALTTAATLKDYEVIIRHGVDSTGPEIHSLYTANTNLDIKRSDVIAWSGVGIAYRDLFIQVRSRDTLLRTSVADQVAFSNPAPAVPTAIVLTPFFTMYWVQHSDLTGDIASVKVWASETSGFTPDVSNLKVDELASIHTIAADADTTYYVRLAAYDDWSDYLPELNVSSEYVVTTESMVVGIVPDPPSDFAATSALVETSPGIFQVQVTLSWTKSDNTDVYDLSILAPLAGIAQLITVTQPLTGTTASYTFIGLSATAYEFMIRSRAATNVSVWSTELDYTTVGDTVAPGVPTSLSLLSGFNAAVVQWVNPSDSDLTGIEVYRTQMSPTSVAEALITTVAAPLTTYYDANLVNAGVYKYRVRAVDRSGNYSGYTSLVSVTISGLPAGSVGSTQILPDSITSAMIIAGTIVAGDIHANTITAAQIAAHTITANEIYANTITATEINASSISTAILTAGSITTTMLTADCITAIQIGANLIITNSANIGTAVILNANIYDATITGAKIANATITNAKITGAIQSSDFVSGVSGWQIDKGGSFQMNGASGASNKTLFSPGKIVIYDSSSNIRLKIGLV